MQGIMITGNDELIYMIKGLPIVPQARVLEQEMIS
jgi:hypothetical protein